MGLELFWSSRPAGPPVSVRMILLRWNVITTGTSRGILTPNEIMEMNFLMDLEAVWRLVPTCTHTTIFVQLYSCNYIRATISGLEYEISYGGIMRQLGAWRPSSGRHPAQAVTSSIKHSNRFTANKFYTALCYAKGISRISFSWIKSACSILLDSYLMVTWGRIENCIILLFPPRFKGFHFRSLEKYDHSSSFISFFCLSIIDDV